MAVRMEEDGKRVNGSDLRRAVMMDVLNFFLELLLYLVIYNAMFLDFVFNLGGPMNDSTYGLSVLFLPLEITYITVFVISVIKKKKKRVFICIGIFVCLLLKSIYNHIVY